MAHLLSTALAPLQVDLLPSEPGLTRLINTTIYESVLGDNEPIKFRDIS